jgi:hypothetical protein
MTKNQAIGEGVARCAWPNIHLRFRFKKPPSSGFSFARFLQSQSTPFFRAEAIDSTGA